MHINIFLDQEREAIKQRWRKLVLETYPADAREFFSQQKNPFLNPVGNAISRQIEALYALLLTDGDDPDAAGILGDFLKIRAVQDFSPAEAVSFILYLKQAIREVLAEQIRSGQLFEELLLLETRIDRILLRAFDIYVNLREKIYEIRANDAQRKLFLTLKKADSASARIDNSAEQESS